MRALLVVNPKATTTSARSRDVLARALRSEVELTVAHTEHRGHAADLARQAVTDSVDVVVTLGGDGTVNEVVNGLLGSGPPPAADEVPALAVVPGGSTNVFARALGLPKDWAEGTGVILEALRKRRTRLIGLGRADGRWFTFCAGLGLDAAVIHRVEQARERGRTATAGLYLRATVTQYLVGLDFLGPSLPGRRAPLLTLRRPGMPAERGLATVIVQNTAPWTYLGDRAVNPNPDASFDTGLDLLALRALHLPTTLRTATQILSRTPNPHGKRILRHHDLSAFTLVADAPVAFQLDGDYLGDRDEVGFTGVPEALRVVC